MAPPPMVLASGSPRRSELLARIVAAFEVDAAHIDEDHLVGEGPAQYVARLARHKAEAGAKRWSGAFVLGADTTVDLNGEVIGKPADEADAGEILARLSGRTHLVHTGIALLAPQRPGGATQPARVVVESAAVTFGELADAEIQTYVRSGEPMGKAGAYALQGSGAALVERIEGDPTTVIGLPLRPTRILLRDSGFPQP